MVRCLIYVCSKILESEKLTISYFKKHFYIHKTSDKNLIFKYLIENTMICLWYQFESDWTSICCIKMCFCINRQVKFWWSKLKFDHLQIDHYRHQDFMRFESYYIFSIFSLWMSHKIVCAVTQFCLQANCATFCVAFRGFVWHSGSDQMLRSSQLLWSQLKSDSTN